MEYNMKFTNEVSSTKANDDSLKALPTIKPGDAR